MTAEEVLKSKLTIESIRLNNSDYTFNKVIEAMELYAEIYHQRKVKILNIPCVTNSEKGKLIAIDNELYLVAENDLNALMQAIGSACGVNCPETVQDVRKECLNIKSKYEPIACEFHDTPADQFKGTELELKDGELPF